jgi:hypothetical protein
MAAWIRRCQKENQGDTRLNKHFRCRTRFGSRQRYLIQALKDIDERTGRRVYTGAHGQKLGFV